MKCPICGSNTLVTDSRYYRHAVYRIRRCKECRNPVYTEEREIDEYIVRDAIQRVRKDHERRKFYEKSKDH